jgi:hypothetical protein
VTLWKTTYTYAARGDDLEVTDTASGEVRWLGKPCGYPVEEVIPIPNSDDCITLLRYWNDPRSFRNLVRVHGEGQIVWAAELPEEEDPEDPDAYVSAELFEGELTANSWSAYQVKLDLDTGRILARTFTK